MLKTLIKLQFQKALARYTANSSNKKKNGKKSSFNSPAVYLALLAFVGVVFAFMFYNMFSMMAPMLATSGFSWLYFLYVMGASFVISTIGCIFLSLSQLYEAKDNELLLSMPIPPRSILFCRMLPLYAQNLLFCALVQVPAFAAYATNASVSASLVVSQIVILLLVPLLSLSVSCILGWLIAFVTSRTRHKNVVTIVFSLVFFALYFLPLLSGRGPCKNTRCKFNWYRCKYNGQCISALSHRTWRIGRLVAAFWCCCRNYCVLCSCLCGAFSQLHKACNSEKVCEESRV